MEMKDDKCVGLFNPIFEKAEEEMLAQLDNVYIDEFSYYNEGANRHERRKNASIARRNKKAKK